ncbi:hypothetical protein [Methylobacter sp.]|uniref:hypothetical protein n=1 Tax=Methylobacter sp. TaxID=2051955 RepID=UPI00121429C9|nr:hypothetical protein [Methylobacter sp.]TAK64580.1 MAG: hypothetical protein EPO18_02920 [Methylobacter sp.]
MQIRSRRICAGIHDCKDAGGRAPTVGALGDVGAVAEKPGTARLRSLHVASAIAPALLYLLHPCSRGYRQSMLE